MYLQIAHQLYQEQVWLFAWFQEIVLDSTWFFVNDGISSLSTAQFYLLPNLTYENFAIRIDQDKMAEDFLRHSLKLQNLSLHIGIWNYLQLRICLCGELQLLQVDKYCNSFILYSLIILFLNYIFFQVESKKKNRLLVSIWLKDLLYPRKYLFSSQKKVFLSTTKYLL